LGTLALAPLYPLYLSHAAHYRFLLDIISDHFLPNCITVFALSYAGVPKAFCAAVFLDSFMLYLSDEIFCLGLGLLV
jgi:hypothetical protein